MTAPFTQGSLPINSSGPISDIKKIPDSKSCPGFSGALQGTRTPGLLIRSQSLYPTELATQVAIFTAFDIITYKNVYVKRFLPNSLIILAIKKPLRKAAVFYVSLKFNDYSSTGASSASSSFAGASMRAFMEKETRCLSKSISVILTSTS